MHARSHVRIFMQIPAHEYIVTSQGHKQQHNADGRSNMGLSVTALKWSSKHHAVSRPNAGFPATASERFSKHNVNGRPEVGLSFTTLSCFFFACPWIRLSVGADFSSRSWAAHR